MSTLSYSLIPTLREYLEKIEESRKRLLLITLNPKIELRLRWEAKINRIYYSLTLSQSKLKHFDIVKIVSNRKKKYPKEEQQAIGLVHAYDFIYQEWLVSDSTITAETIVNMHRTISSAREKGSYKDLKILADYLKTSRDHPIIQAAIICIQLLKLHHFTDANARLSRLLSYLFLYKYGYDFRGLLVFEWYWYENHSIYSDILSKSLKSENITYWIIYFAKTIAVSLEQIELALREATIHWRTDLKLDFWQLSDRQKSILSFLDNPNTTVTNRKVQSLYGVSQITASRDLAKLVVLGLLFAHGKGRSIYYTKL